MNRRQVLSAGIVATGFAAVLPSLSFAEDVPVEPIPALTVTSTISNNHGHEFTLTPIEAVKLLRSTKTGGPVAVDIHGQSSHGHNIVLAHENFLALFVDGQVQISSVGGSHSHSVLIKLDAV